MDWLLPPQVLLVRPGEQLASAVETIQRPESVLRIEELLVARIVQLHERFQS